MLSARHGLLVLACCSVTLAIGADLKSIFFSNNGRCGENQTPCHSADGVKCCGLPLGVCCGNGETCCPIGFVCDAESDKCMSSYGSISQRSTTLPQPSKASAVKPTNASCTTKQCNADQTCCHDDWDCCPVPEAVCCKDKGHCCPHGYICDDQPFICRWPDDGHIVKTLIFREVASKNLVVCDGEKSCREGSTCCQLPDGDWGCCPVKNAVCCDDHIHCCAEGTTCDTEHGRCNSKSGLESLAWLTKQPIQTQLVGPVKEVQCDSAHYCPSGNTCCRLASGQWGCCPAPNAVCCDDHVHCCPSGYTCSTGTGECRRGLTSIPWLSKEPVITTASEKIVQCDSTHYCPSGNTCCRLASGQWGCCPIPNAVCCDDHVHCCPSGYSCSTGTCRRGLTSIPWLSKEPVITTASERDVQCDSTHYCPSGNTCCRLASGQWGCCPIPNAVCCDDHIHCCPSGYTCSTGTCRRGLTSIPWLSKEPVITSASERDVQCDSTHYCPSGNTCCRLASGQWGCCPVPNAVCCDDHIHCCPSGYTCSTGTCRRGLTSIPWLSKEPVITSASERDVQCDSTHYCPSGNTCCRLASGQWGCCPIPNAVCCDDHVHCCPSGYTCSTGTCRRGLTSIPWLSKEPVITTASEKIVQCDSTHYCPSGSTCCRLASGQWGCCPIPNAVCCDDHIHCCPSGYSCSTGTCRRGLTSIPWLSKEPVITTASEKNVQCDSTHYCPSGSTCCRLSSGQWGCCPVPNAVCCDDHIHCCPSGYTCSTGTCRRGLTSIPWLSKEPVITSASERDVQCDSTHYCPSGNTCCRLASGQWGCCPVPNAVCCDDHIHCCPSGYTCSTGTCRRGLTSIPWLSKEPVITSASERDVQCDSTHYCPSGNTCCRLASGQWGCCPVPNAVCCDDHIHCCPSGYTCSTGTCRRGLTSIPWLSKEPVITTASEKNVQCDSTHYCPSGSTCCRLASGQWGCCPIPNAVCCDDHIHCCPSGYSCSTGTCRRGLTSIPWLSKEPVVTTASEKNVQCDSTHYCPPGSTCCRLSSGQWGCCPIPNAVCCDDHIHCCPSGYTCSTGTCRRGLTSIPWLSKEPVITTASERDVQCDSTHYCPSGSTCCRLASGQWGCCPIPNAVCCDDHIHCCPSGYSCSTGTCRRGLTSIPWLSKEPVITTASEKNVQCDSTHYCPSGSTCCRLSSGQWGCCPVPNAVCCDDHIHCCPSGYTCSTGTCRRGLTSIPWLSKEPVITTASEKDVQCDSTHYCPSGNTCCRLASGQWGCCPVPNAVCCDDHVHCCPSGYSCSTGECHRGLTSIPWLSKEPVITIASERNVQCDSTHYCPSGNTCCRLASGQWGCCPVPNAVCCDDHVHCCPSGYSCSTGACRRGLTSIPWLSKEPVITTASERDVQCDSTHYCPSGNTCCRLASGQWGCCPVPNAVCCDDHVHCCPSGYSCSTGACRRGLTSIPWLSKEPVITIASERDVQCDSTHYCPSGNTCCRLASGQWGCCPVPNAVCCDDHVHCCPSGYSCSTGTGECRRGLTSIPWLSKEPVITIASEKNVQCDSTHYCPSGNTCCRLASGQWGCCPAPNAVCCDDHVHCCPSGYTCSAGTGQCFRDEILNSAMAVHPSTELLLISSATSKTTSVSCDDQFECPDGYTCCPMAGGTWGCCPYVDAMCCSDGLHCCPAHFTCDTSEHRCLNGDGLEDRPFYQLLAASSVERRSNE